MVMSLTVESDTIQPILWTKNIHPKSGLRKLQKKCQKINDKILLLGLCSLVSLPGTSLLVIHGPREDICGLVIVASDHQMQKNTQIQTNYIIGQLIMVVPCVKQLTICMLAISIICSTLLNMWKWFRCDTSWCTCQTQPSSMSPSGGSSSRMQKIYIFTTFVVENFHNVL